MIVTGLWASGIIPKFIAKIAATSYLKNNFPKKQTDEFLRLCMTYLENKGYEVYVGNTRYSYNNATQNVQPNELLIAFKNDK